MENDVKEIIENNVNLVKYIANKYKNEDVEELIGVGMEGLIKGAQTFQEGKSKLSTYLSVCIDNQIKIYLNKNNRIKKHVSISLDNEVCEEGYLRDVIPSNISVEREVLNILDNEMLLDIINNTSLTKQEQFVIKNRYGIGSENFLTQQNIADMTNVTRSRISKVERVALKKMKIELDKIGYKL